MSKFDAMGVKEWMVEAASNDVQFVSSSTVDVQDMVYVTGTTSCSLLDGAVGLCNMFVSKFDSDGNHLWTSIVSNTKSCSFKKKNNDK